MNPQNLPLRERVFDRDDDLQDAVRQLLRNAIRRQMWLLFLDDQRRLGDLIMPMDDYPHDPDGMVTTEDLGTIPCSRLLMQRCEMVREASESGAVVLVWERPGPRALDVATRRWACAMAVDAHELDVPLRAQFLLHDDGIRQLHPDDYLA